MKTTIVLISIVSCFAQTPSDKKPAFDVASIRVVKDDGDHDIDTDKGFFRTHNISLKRLVAFAYGVDARNVLGGPPWADGDGYDIVARIPPEFAQSKRDPVPLMVQALLAERFQVVTSRQPRQISGYALVQTKKGSRMTPTAPGQDKNDLSSHSTHMVGQGATMASLAEHLSHYRDIGAIVVDRTGLSGRFDFELDWKPDPVNGADDDRPAIFRALQEQLGLQLDTAKVPTEAIVIERAEKPAEN